MKPGTFPENSTATISPRRRRRIIWIQLTVLAVCVAVILGRGRGYKTRLLRHFDPEYGMRLHPSVRATRPTDHQINVLPDAFIAVDVNLPNHARTVDAATLEGNSVRLVRVSDGAVVPAVVNTSGGGDDIVLKPIRPLDLNTEYTFQVSADVRDTGGARFLPYSCSFTTAATADFVSLPIAFEKIALPIADGSMYTCVEIGPDHRLYASTLDGRILRFSILSDGTLSDLKTIKTIQKAEGGPRLITGIKFDPASSPERLILWVNHGELPPLRRHDSQGLISGAADWSGKLSRLSGPDLKTDQDWLIHLPRSLKDHLNNQIAFGPDGALYFCQASNTAMGAPDSTWGFRPERRLTAAVLRVDVGAIHNPPLDVKTEQGGHYDPYAPGAPVTIYADGIRNSFDLLWSDRGFLYCGTNGSSAGGNTPGTPSDLSTIHRADDAVHGAYRGPRVPALHDVKQTEDDFLFRVDKGGYYGHPNPTRGEFVLDGGNRTGGKDSADVTDYPLGTQPDRNWHAPIYSFGKDLSPCGVVQYRSDAFGGALRGTILFVRYSGGDDIIALTPDAAGNIVRAQTGIEGFTQFVNPVDLTEDPADGDLYVAEFGAKHLTLLRPLHGDRAVSRRVCVQNMNPPAGRS